MKAALASWWRVRSLREQRLLLVMFALLFLVLGWLLVVRPLGDALDDARRGHAAAVETLAAARARAEAAGRTAMPASAAAPLPVDAWLRRTATEAGFAGARITAQGPARASVAIDAARPPAVFGWLSRLEQTGLAVESLRARTNADRTLAVEAVLSARRG